MSKTRSRAVAVLAAAILALFVMEDGARAARGSTQSYAPPSESSSYKNQMMIDLGVHYVRNTKPDGGSDTAGRFSIGGMFNEWLGLDGQGLFEVRSRNYLVGGDFRIVPVDWFFLKAGAGAYASKETNTLSVTPLFGAGIMARMTRDIYLVTETSYFSVNTRDNISFGVGLGTTF